MSRIYLTREEDTIPGTGSAATRSHTFNRGPRWWQWRGQRSRAIVNDSLVSRQVSPEVCMKVRQLGKGGLTVSAIGLGCMGMSQSYGPGDEAESIRTLHRALDIGGRTDDQRNHELAEDGFTSDGSMMCLARRRGCRSSRCSATRPVVPGAPTRQLRIASGFWSYRIRSSVVGNRASTQITIVRKVSVPTSSRRGWLRVCRPDCSREVAQCRRSRCVRVDRQIGVNQAPLRAGRA
jgi:hypothetical protein